MNIAFPEDIGQLPQVAKRPLALKHVLALVYCFGGVAGVLAILSKFVTTPLFEQLTYDRSVFANEARLRAMDINAQLASIASRTPPTEAKSGYLTQVVEAGDRAPARAPSASAAASADMIKSLKELRMLMKSTDPNDSQLRQVGLLTSQTEELAKYSRSLQYQPVPGTFTTRTMSKDLGSDADFGEVIMHCKKEIRALKGSILAI